MGVSMITALEIFTNPDDLKIVIEQKNDGDKFSIGIFRGPSHNYKPMLTSQPFAEKPEDAIKEIKEILESIRQAVTNEFADRKSLPFQYLNPDRQEIDQSKVLNLDTINQILDELRQRQVASTYKMPAPSG